VYYYRGQQDRSSSYYYGFAQRIPRAIKWLLIINAFIFAVQRIVPSILGPLTFEFVFGLVPSLFLNKLWLWQPVTYMFLHGSLPHILMNMFSLWMFGSAIERSWGTGKFLKYYFITGVGAGLLTIAFTPFSIVPTIGASGAIYGILLAFGLTFPERPIYLYFIFPVKAKHFVLFFAVLEFYFAWQNTGDGIAHLAHFGGMLLGYLYMKRAWRLRDFLADLRWKLKRRKFKVMDDEWKKYRQ
jgi:membrane associated rhomboid family serine protease